MRYVEYQCKHGDLNIVYWPDKGEVTLSSGSETVVIHSEDFDGFLKEYARYLLHQHAETLADELSAAGLIVSLFGPGEQEVILGVDHEEDSEEAEEIVDHEVAECPQCEQDYVYDGFTPCPACRPVADDFNGGL